MTLSPISPLSLLERPGHRIGNGLIFAYPELGLLTLCDKLVFPTEVPSLIETVDQAQHTSTDLPRHQVFRVSPSHECSEVDVFVIESGDNDASCYFDEVPLTPNDVEYYKRHLREAARMCQGKCPRSN